MISHCRALAGLLVLSVGTSTATAQRTAAAVRSAPSGTLFIVGGGTQPPELVSHFIALAGGPGKARIAIFPMASSEAEASGKDKADQLRGMGTDAYVVNITREQAESDSVVQLVTRATGIWFPGGDQVRLADVLRGTKVLRAIQDRYRAGAVIGGTSAGAAIMSDSMLTGNQLRDGVVDTSTTGYPRVARKNIEIVPGLGFLHGAIVDQHFLRRQRSNRLLSVTLEHPTMLGVGIDEGTALRVDPDGTWTIEGASAALVFDARAAAVTPTAARTLGATELRLHLLPAGSTYDPRSGRASLPRK